LRAIETRRRERVMHDFLHRDIDYVIRLDEILWGGALLALTMAIHSAGMIQTLRLNAFLLERTRHNRTLSKAMGILIMATWMITLVSLFEVALWAQCFVWLGAQPNNSSALYYAILNYTTLNAGYLPVRWRLLEGMLGMAGLLSYAWSAGVLFSLAQPLTEEALQAVRRKHNRQPGPKSGERPPGGGSAQP
jgi:4-amino-4-deoxy-L-arabinose transferase-like glycosyltransferase